MSDQLPTLKELYANHRGKVSDKWEIYIAEYDRLFQPYRDQPVSVLEIGIQNGGSLEIWNKFFSNAQKIIGCDINPSCGQLQFDDPKIAVIVCDANTTEAEQQILAQAGKFDLIIDDGSHQSSDIVRSFSRYFPHLNDGGVYIAEDLHCSYWKDFDGGIFQPYSPIAFFKRLADTVNHEHWGVETSRSELLESFNRKYELCLQEEVLAHIHSIEFVNSLCIIRKENPEKNILGLRHIAGVQALVWEGALQLHGSRNATRDQSENYWAKREAPVEEALMATADELSAFRKLLMDRDKERDHTTQASLAREVAHQAERDLARQQIEAQLLQLAEREKAFSDQLLQLRQFHDQQNSQHAQTHDDRQQAHQTALDAARQNLETHLLQLAEREKSFAEQHDQLRQLHAQERSAQNQVQAEREQAHQTELGLARQKFEAQLMQLAEREKVSAEQVQQLRQLHDQQISDLTQVQAEREQAHQAELGLTRQKIETQLLQLAEREKVSAEQLHELRQLHDQQTSELTQTQVEREQAHQAELGLARQKNEAQLMQLAEREKAFSAQLQVMYLATEQQRNAQEQQHADREQAHRAQLTQAQQQIEAHLLQLTEREKQFSDQLQRAQQSYQQQIITQKQEHIEREQLLDEQLAERKRELLNKLGQWTETENLHALAVGELHRELNAIRSTFSWRWTAPLRTLVGALGTQSGSKLKTVSQLAANDVLLEERPPDLAPHIIEASPPFSNSSLNENNRVSEMTLSQTGVAARTLEELLSHHDERFIHTAYKTLLGRAPDLEGMHYYLGKVRSGVSKLDVISQLRLSDEGQSREVSMLGLEAAVKRYKWFKTSLLGLLFRLLSIDHLEGNTRKQLRAIENKIYLLDTQLQNNFSEINRSVSQLRRQIDNQEKTFKVLIRSSIENQNKSISSAKMMEISEISELELKPDSDTTYPNQVEASTDSALDTFDEIWYSEQNPEAMPFGLSPYEHYIQYGKSQCRTPMFNGEWYLQEYPDVALAGADAYDHYIQHGKIEGRHPAFNSYWYLSEYLDIAEAGIDPYDHYLQYGKEEGRYPSFDRHWYLKKYPDVAAAGVDPYEHYVHNGKSEGRHPAYNPKKTDSRSYAQWIVEFDTLTDSMRKGMQMHIAKLKCKPLVSVVMPVYNPNIEWLKQAINSVLNQIYQNWELCIADDASSDSAVRSVLEQYSQLDPRIKVIFRETNGHISAASNSALSLATGEWIALLDHDDLLAEHGLFWVVDAVNKNSNSRMIYSDDDNIDEQGQRANPYFKCNWNPDLFYSHNLFGHLGVYYSKLVRDVGGFRIGMEGSQDYDLALRCLDKIDAAQVHHIPRVLYHWRVHAESTAFSSDAKPYAMVAGQKAINEHFQRQGIDAKVEFLGYAYKAVYALPANQPLVSLIIPTRNGLALLQQCIESILTKTSYTNYEILVVDNGSDDLATLKYLEQIATDIRIRVVRDEGPFNYSALNNSAVKKCRGEVVGLINNDIEVISPDWLSEMVSHALRPGVGAVGARLWYPNDTLQHGGVILGIGSAAGHSHKGLPSDRYGYFNRAVLTQSYSAVTAACLIIKRSIYEQVDGLNEVDLSIAYNDVDFCIRVREAGYRNIWTPHAELYHHESATRGHEDTPEKKARLAKEMSYLKTRWGDLLLNDPCYSPNLTLEKEDFSFAWPPRIESNESFLIPYDSEFQSNENFSNQKTDIKAITFYLPQFHTCKQNDEWWGEGFTEWTNTKQAKPHFEGHYQPREPHDDIGYYDLSEAESMRKQANLAREHGIHGFCFYHYWFSGNRVLEKPVDLLLKNLDIDINFCLCWANENWTRTWDGLNTNILLEQKYLPEDPVNFIKDIRVYLKDPRYIRIDNKPVVIVYKSHCIPNASDVFNEWRNWWRENEGEELLIWCTRTDHEDIGLKKLKNSINAVVEFPPAIFPYNIDGKRLPFDTSGYFHDYQKMISDITSNTQFADTPTVDFYRSVMLGWDNSARRKKGWSAWFGFSISSYYRWLRHTIDYTRKSFPVDRRFVFINAWNEWAEGTYLEPDRKYGYASINTTSRALFDLPLNNPSIPDTFAEVISQSDQKKPIHRDDLIALNEANDLAVVIHVFYLDVFKNIIEYLNKIDTINIHVYVTCSRILKKDLLKVLKRQTYKYTILILENRGRDVLPFLKIMPKVIGDAHDYVLKIHTKKTTHREDGNLWRTELFDQLIDKEAMMLSFAYLKNNSDVGILGPVGHVISMRDYYGSNKEKVQTLATRLGLSPGELNSLSFVAGTMFMARTTAFQPLLSLELKDSDFEEEAGQTDGTLAHAIERALSASSWASGMKVASISEQVNSDYSFAAKTPLS